MRDLRKSRGMQYIAGHSLILLGAAIALLAGGFWWWALGLGGLFVFGCWLLYQRWLDEQNL